MRKNKADYDKNLKEWLEPYTSDKFMDRIKAMVNSGTYFSTYEELYNSVSAMNNANKK